MQKKQPIILTSFSYNAEIKFNESEYKGIITRNDNSNFNIKITSPKSMNGMEVTCCGNDIKINFGELSYSLTTDEINNYSLIMTLVSVFNSLSRVNEITAESYKNGFKYSGKCSDGNFTLYQNYDNTYEKLIVNKNLSINFSNTKV